MSLEQMFFDAIKNRFPDIERNYRPEWLINDLTGKRLELDGYSEEARTAWEMDGMHHKLQYQKYKDDIKLKECQKRGITLIRFNKRKKIVKYLQSLGINNEKFLKRIRKYKMSRRMFRTYGKDVGKQIRREQFRTDPFLARMLQEQETKSIERRRSQGSTL